MNPIMFDEIDLLWLIALDDIRSAHGDSSAFDAFIVGDVLVSDASPKCRPVVDTRSPTYYTLLIREFERRNREAVRRLKAEFRAVAQDHSDPYYLGYLEQQLRDLGEEPDPADPFEEAPF